MKYSVPIVVVAVLLTLFVRCRSQSNDYPTAIGLQHMEASFDNYREQVDRNTGALIDDYIYNHKFDTERYYPYYRFAASIRDCANDVITYLGEWRDTLKNDKVSVSQLMTANGGASGMKARLEKAVKKMTSTISQSDTALLMQMFRKQYSDIFVYNTSWEEEHFGNNISSNMARANLARIQSDVASIVHLLVTRMIEEGNRGCVLRLDPRHAMAVTKYPFYFIGDKVEANVFPVIELNHDLDSVTRITVNGRKLMVGYRDMGIYEEIAGAEGIKSYPGVLTMKNHKGETHDYEFSLEYTAVKPSAIVVPDKMQQLYTGVPNPISVLAAFTTSDKLVVTLSRGKITGSRGKYVVTVPEPGEVTIRVGAKQDNGYIAPMDSVIFMVVTR